VTSILVSSRSTLGELGGPVIPPARTLAITLEPYAPRQRWCWASVAVGVARFYDAQTQWTMCSLASDLMYADCGAEPTLCDDAFPLEDALKRVGNFHAPVVEEHLDFEALSREIANGRPVAARICWSGGGDAHYVVVRGYDRSLMTVEVTDPRTGDSHAMPYSELCSGYEGDGSWEQSYRTSGGP